MYELVQVSEHCFYVQSPAKIGIVELGGGEVCLIDSGNDKNAGRKVRQILDAHGWRLQAIYNTHSNADHIGGNRYLQGQTGCRVFAPGIECAFTQHPILEPSFLFGGYPPKDLRHKFLLAQASDCEPLVSEALPVGIEIIELPGHFFAMVGFRVSLDEAGEVVYLADCLSSEATLAKYGVTFVYDVAAYLATLERVRAMEAAIFVPAHADATDDIAPLAEANIAKVHEVAERVFDLCASPATTDDVIHGVFCAYDLAMSFEQYALVGSTVRSYLAYLRNAGRLDILTGGHELRWAQEG